MFTNNEQKKIFPWKRGTESKHDIVVEKTYTHVSFGQSLNTGKRCRMIKKIVVSYMCFFCISGSI